MWTHLCNQESVLQDKSRRHLSAYGVGQPTRCTTIKAILGYDGAAAICGFDNGSIGASVWFPGLPVATITRPCSISGEQISAIGLERDSRLGDSEASSASTRFLIGTSAGINVEWMLDVAYGITTPYCQWQAHAPSPNESADYRGACAVDLQENSFVSGGSDGSVCLWEAKEGDDPGASLVRRIDAAHGGAVTCVADGVSARQAFSAGEDGVTRFWDQKVDHELPSHGKDARAKHWPITCMQLDYRNLRLLNAAEDCYVRMWDISVGQATRRFLHESSQIPKPGLGRRSAWKGVQAVAFNSADDALTQLASTSWDGTWRVWDVRTAKDGLSPVQKEHETPIISVAFRRERLLTASLDGLLVQWDVRMLSPKPLEKVHMIGFGLAGRVRKKRGDNCDPACCDMSQAD
eukprot:CAMPEP_0197693332 /NCGR_PEP_ID=MMETSP1338-20131121/112366_1 /TAXON_ID=43686 ORGANISM="Pelagodinium beii, Strain RCC1491" /NCGR_SAMPLE_ID=MMETSP1338 /ASSEMBLY_ACC=CAM_ASM_000754 /LENGTH=405 /DNA_ID=CAMNT_0043276065 /DNA_START=54 /DNA_END=1271 /DNA_ORIENTATION=-